MENKISKKYSNWIGYVLAVILLHIIGVILLIFGAKHHPEMLGMGILSYTLGLRHAFDADHIAAIDNTIRKLVQQKKNPSGVGFFFSFGHSTVVIIMAVATIFSISIIQNKMPKFKQIGGMIALGVSGAFLILIGLINLYFWIDTYKNFKKIRRGENSEEDNRLDNKNGFLNRITKYTYGFISKSYHVYILGFLFGLGFDTATQIAMLSTSAGAASQAIPLVSVLAFPILFTAGMSLMDTLDGFFMVSAYKWVFSTPLRKVYYNLTITGLSVIAALFIGLIEIAQLITINLQQNSSLGWIQNINFNTMGYVLIVMFILVWGISYAGWKILKIGD